MRVKVSKVIFLKFINQRHHINNEVNWVKGSPIKFIVKAARASIAEFWLFISRSKLHQLWQNCLFWRCEQQDPATSISVTSSPGIVRNLLNVTNRSSNPDWQGERTKGSRDRLLAAQWRTIEREEEMLPFPLTKDNISLYYHIDEPLTWHIKCF